jgi:cytochrome c biogenesis protein CcdA
MAIVEFCANLFAFFSPIVLGVWRKSRRQSAAVMPEHWGELRTQ